MFHCQNQKEKCYPIKFSIRYKAVFSVMDPCEAVTIYVGNTAKHLAPKMKLSFPLTDVHGGAPETLQSFSLPESS